MSLFHLVSFLFEAPMDRFNPNLSILKIRIFIVRINLIVLSVFLDKWTLIHF